MSPRIACTPALALVGLIALAACARPPYRPYAEFEASRTRADLARYAGSEGRCVHSRPGHELCAWRLSNRQLGWEALAESIGTPDQVNLVCELPADGGPRAEHSCAVHPRRAAGFDVAARAPSVGAPPVAAQPSEVSRRDRALRRIEAAGDVVALSDLVGDGPDECVDADPGEQLCVWKLSVHDRGWEVVAAAIDSDGRVRMACTLPSDGSTRVEGSCRIVPGR